ncbi:MAG: hypothetical protein KDE27_19380 [Planctomycetes bacterium]|nr:hypothetical protein [Planctomycetota bacterium]
MTPYGMWASQRTQSRNAGESWPTFLRRCFWAIRYWFRGVRVGLGAMRHTVVGSRVRFRGEEIWEISNWSWPSRSSTLVGPLAAPAGVRQRIERVPCEDFVPVLSVRELWHRFSSRYWWWMTSWHDIVVNDRVWRRPRAGRERTRQLERRASR